MRHTLEKPATKKGNIIIKIKKKLPFSHTFRRVLFSAIQKSYFKDKNVDPAPQEKARVFLSFGSVVSFFCFSLAVLFV